MTDLEGDRSTILIHYYRAMVGRADVWRMRMDATTNWAIGATAAVISFVLGDDQTPHYVVFIAVLLTVSFLLLEARRLSFYHLWQQRAQLIEEGLIRPALRTMSDSPTDTSAFDLIANLDPHLGRTIPNMPRMKAVARRLRRIYLYLFAVQVFAWAFKLAETPTSASSLGEVIARATTGAIPGGWIVAGVVVGFLSALAIAVAFGGVSRRQESPS